MAKRKQNDNWDVISLALAIFSCLIWFMPYFGLPIAIASRICYNRQKKITPAAKAARIIGVLGIVINSIVLLGIVLVIAASLF